MPARWPADTDAEPDVASALPFLNRAVRRGRDVARNAEGGDVGGFGSAQLVARHVANYQVAADVVGALDLPAGPVLDVGCGVGALSAWVADRLGRALVLCDRDAQVVAFGGETFGVPAHTELAEVDAAPVVLAMEVLEHVEPAEQAGFLAQLWERVLPGGALVLSTPDETGYPGGWSGYGPHVGCVSPRQLHALLAATTDTEVLVCRLEGGPFALSGARRVLERVANSTWTAVQRLAPRAATAAAGRATRPGDLALGDVAPAATPYRVVPPTHGTGTGLVALARRPAS